MSMWGTLLHHLEFSAPIQEPTHHAPFQTKRMTTEQKSEARDEQVMLKAKAEMLGWLRLPVLKAGSEEGDIP